MLLRKGEGPINKGVHESLSAGGNLPPFSETDRDTKVRSVEADEMAGRRSFV